jgi:hypothetical protein
MIIVLEFLIILGLFYYGIILFAFAIGAFNTKKELHYNLIPYRMWIKLLIDNYKKLE